MKLNKFLNLLIQQVFSLLSILLLTIVFIPNISNNVMSLIYEEQKYAGIEVDFILTNPRPDQIIDIEQTENIIAVTPYYLLETTFNEERSLPNSKLFSIPNLSNNTLLLFSEDKVIERISTSEIIPTDSILIDQVIAQRYSLSIGSLLTVSFNNYFFTYSVHAIYSSIPLYPDGIALIAHEGLYEEATNAVFEAFGTHVYYAGAWVNVVETTPFISYLRDEYIPLGRVGYKEDYEDPSEYDLLYDYAISNYNFDKDNVFLFTLKSDSLDLLNTINQRIKNQFILYPILYGLIYSLYFLVMISFSNNLKVNFTQYKKVFLNDLVIYSSMNFTILLAISLVVSTSQPIAGVNFLLFPLVSLVVSTMLFVLYKLLIKQFRELKIAQD